MCVCVYVCVFMCVCVCVYIYIYIYIYIYELVIIGKYACNTHPVSVYYGEVEYGSNVMREGGRKVVVICYKN